MEHSGLHHHTAATALLYMWPLLLRAGEWGDTVPPLVQSALNPSHSSLPSAECCRNTAVFSHLCLMQQHLEICTHFLCPPLRSSLISFDNLSRGNRHGTLWAQATYSFFTNLSTVRKETLIKNGNFQRFQWQCSVICISMTVLPRQNNWVFSQFSVNSRKLIREKFSAPSYHTKYASEPIIASLMRLTYSCCCCLLIRTQRFTGNRNQMSYSHWAILKLL